MIADNDKSFVRSPVGNVSSLDLKVPPYSLEAEMAVLGCMMLEREALERSLEALEENAFYDAKNRKIFVSLKEMSMGDKVVDILTLGEELKRREVLASCGGAEYLTRLIDTVPTTAHLEEYIRIVREKEILRHLINAATQVVGNCYKQDEEPNELLDQAEKLIYDIADQRRRGARSGLLPVSGMLHEMVENLEQLHQRKETVTGISTGFKRFDEMTTGLQKGNLIILAARPGVGKTALALNVATHVGVKKKLPVAIFSLEMSQQEIGMRLLSSIAEIPLQNLRTGFFRKEHWPIITRKAEVLSESPIYLDYSTSAVSILTLRAAARRLAIQLKNKGTPLSLIIIDYLQLMQGSRRNPESRQTEIAEISRSLKGLARDLDLPIIALSQLNRSTEERGRDGKPQLSDLRESGAIEQDADLVGFIYREGMYKKHSESMTQEEYDALMRQAKLIIAKQRNGPLGEIDLVFIKECARFSDAEPESDNF